MARGVGLRVGPKAEERGGAVRSVKLGPLPEASNLIGPLDEATNPMASNNVVRAEMRAVICGGREVSVRFSSLPPFRPSPLPGLFHRNPGAPGGSKSRERAGWTWKAVESAGYATAQDLITERAPGWRLGSSSRWLVDAVGGSKAGATGGPSALSAMMASLPPSWQRPFRPLEP